MLCHYVECRCTLCHYVECRYPLCHYANKICRGDRHYSECRGALISFLFHLVKSVSLRSVCLSECPVRFSYCDEPGPVVDAEGDVGKDILGRVVA